MCLSDSDSFETELPTFPGIHENETKSESSEEDTSSNK